MSPLHTKGLRQQPATAAAVCLNAWHRCLQAKRGEALRRGTKNSKCSSVNVAAPFQAALQCYAMLRRCLSCHRSPSSPRLGIRANFGVPNMTKSKERGREPETFGQISDFDVTFNRLSAPYFWKYLPCSTLRYFSFSAFVPSKKSLSGFLKATPHATPAQKGGTVPLAMEGFKRKELYALAYNRFKGFFFCKNNRP